MARSARHNSGFSSSRSEDIRILEAQQRHFSYRAMLVAIVSQNCFLLVFSVVSHDYCAIRCKMGYRPDVPV